MIIEEFLGTEGREFVRERIEAAVAGGRVGGRVVWDFSFDVFDLRLDFEAGTAFIEDSLTVGPAGEQRLPIGEFLGLLGF